MQTASIYIPTFILNWIADHSSHPRIARVRDVKNTVAGLVKQVVQEKTSALSQGNVNQDIATLLSALPSCCLLPGSCIDYFSVKANMDANNKMSDEELLAQFWYALPMFLTIQIYGCNVYSTVLITAHAMTTNSLAWIVLEIARNPKVQSKLRDEIRATEATIRARANPQLRIEDLASMPYLNATIKVNGIPFLRTVLTYPHHSISNAGRITISPC